MRGDVVKKTRNLPKKGGFLFFYWVFVEVAVVSVAVSASCIERTSASAWITLASPASSWRNNELETPVFSWVLCVEFHMNAIDTRSTMTNIMIPSSTVGFCVFMARMQFNC